MKTRQQIEKQLMETLKDFYAFQLSENIKKGIRAKKNKNWHFLRNKPFTS